MGLSLDTKHELIESVGSTLDAVDGAELGVDLATGEDRAIAGGAHVEGIVWITDSPGSSLEVSREELRECLIMPEVWLRDLFHVDSVEFGEAAIEDVSEGPGQSKGAQETCDPGASSSEGHDVLDVVVLLEDLIERVNGIPSCEKHSQQVLNRFLPALV